MTYTTRSVTRRKDQRAFLKETALEFKDSPTLGNAIVVLRAAMKCPDLLTTDPVVRNCVLNLVCDCAFLNYYTWNSNNDMTAAIEEIDMVTEGIRSRPDYVE